MEARLSALEAATGSYRSELALAQGQAAAAQAELAVFDEAHRPPFDAVELYEQGQLRAAVEDAKGRVTDLKARIERSSVMAGIVQTADSLDFRVVDEPVEDARPSGGTKPAAMIAGSAMAAGLALAALLVLGCTLLTSRVRAEAETLRPVPANLFAAPAPKSRETAPPERVMT